jgi:general L-amino acid transport system substrate-binding protein
MRLVVLASTFAFVTTASAQSTLEAVKARGQVVCGVGVGVPGFAEADDKGHWSGLEVDFCQAMAAAVLGRREAVQYRPLSIAERFSALKAGEVDVLLRATTWTLARDAEHGVRFVAPYFHDGHKLLIRRTQALTSVLELSGATICVEAGSSAEQAIADFFGARKMRFEAIAAPRFEDALRNYLAGGCMALAGEGTQLAARRNRLQAPADHVLLPENVSREPLGPVVRTGDDRWFAIVRWVVFALIAAEDLGITSANVEQQRLSGPAEARRLLGGEGQLGVMLGLQPTWAYDMIRLVGNYGEIFERNMGMKSALKLERGLNNLWSRNGLMFAPAFR